MQAERDCLRSFVFPELEERLRARRHFLEPIDLRLGVDPGDAADEEAREIRVLKVCLSEIQRSRPFLIVLLGDRYGWVPSRERAQAAAREAGFDIDVRDKSVTALEIEFGILKEDTAQRHRPIQVATALEDQRLVAQPALQRVLAAQFAAQPVRFLLEGHRAGRSRQERCSYRGSRYSHRSHHSPGNLCSRTDSLPAFKPRCKRLITSATPAIDCGPSCNISTSRIAQ